MINKIKEIYKFFFTWDFDEWIIFPYKIIAWGMVLMISIITIISIIKGELPK